MILPLIIPAILSAFLIAFVVSIDEVVVALSAEIAQDPPAYLLGAAKPLRMVAGGARRQDSVSNAFDAAAAASCAVVGSPAARG